MNDAFDDRLFPVTKAGKAEAEARKLIDELKARRNVLKENMSELKRVGRCLGKT